MEELIEKLKKGEITNDAFLIAFEEKRKTTLTFNDLASVEQAFKVIFQKSTYVITKNVKVGGTSGNVYVPKKFAGMPVTVIVWSNDKFEGIKEAQ